MPKPVVITADSAADLLPHIREEFGVHILPLHIILEGRDGLDSETIFPMDIYNAFQQRGALPKTSAPSLEELKGFFRPFVEQGYAVVHISVSSTLSSTYQISRLAAEEVGGEIHVYDSKHFCLGQGMLCVQAALLRDQGLSAEEIVERLPELRRRVKAMYYLDGLSFAAKSGRCPPFLARMASMLNMHPAATVSLEGEFVIGKKYRGKSADASEAWLRDSAAKFLETCDPALCWFFHTPDIGPEKCGPLEEIAAALLPGVGRMIMDTVGCTIVAHVGGGCYALVGMEKA